MFTQQAGFFFWREEGRGWVHCVNPAQAAKVRLHAWLSFSVFCLFCLVFWKKFKFKFPLILESVANIQII